MSEPQTHLVTVDLSAAEARERHIEALASEIKQPVARVLRALGFRDPLLRGGQWRMADVAKCPTCGVGADPKRPDDAPLLVGAQKVTCVCGCEFDARGLLETFAPTPEKLDAALSQISVGRAELTRFYCLELQTNSPAENEEPKYRRAAGANVIELLRRLEVTGESIVRGVAVDAADMMTAQATIRSEGVQIPWRDRLPLDHKGELMDVGWHGAELSRNERELQRRRRAG
jgi:hypothetical protein